MNFIGSPLTVPNNQGGDSIDILGTPPNGALNSALNGALIISLKVDNIF